VIAVELGEHWHFGSIVHTIYMTYLSALEWNTMFYKMTHLDDKARIWKKEAVESREAASLDKEGITADARSNRKEYDAGGMITDQVGAQAGTEAA
jgi:hypothetical protein